jgi:hypothetical protein
MHPRHPSRTFAAQARRLVAALAAAGAVLACLPAAAAAAPVQRTENATLGAVTAAFTYTQTDDTAFTLGTLSITRAGGAAFQGPAGITDCDQYCWPGSAGDPDRSSVHIVDLAGDGEPDVLLDLFSGGAHCCSITRFFVWNGSGYAEFDHNFADPGYRRADLNHDHVVELVSADPRFAYEFASYAESFAPIQIWHLGAGDLVDVTGRFRDRIRKNADLAYGLYRKYHSRGPIAAWAADRYRLGQRKSTLKKLRRLAAAHKLPSRGSPPGSQKKFVTKLDAFLRGLGYA